MIRYSTCLLLCFTAVFTQERSTLVQYTHYPYSPRRFDGIYGSVVSREQMSEILENDLMYRLRLLKSELETRRRHNFNAGMDSAHSLSLNDPRLAHVGAIEGPNAKTEFKQYDSMRHSQIKQYDEAIETVARLDAEDIIQRDFVVAPSVEDLYPFHARR